MEIIKDIKLHNLQYANGSIKRKKIVGRGRNSGHGVKCGKGSNGNKQRSGYKYKPGFEGGQTPLKKRLPMIRIINKFRKDKPKEIKIDTILPLVTSGIKEIDGIVLSDKDFINKNQKYKFVMGRQKDVNFNGVTIVANGFSKESKDFIENNGGKCIIIDKSKLNNK